MVTNHMVDNGVSWSR